MFMCSLTSCTYDNHCRSEYYSYDYGKATRKENVNCTRNNCQGNQSTLNRW